MRKSLALYAAVPLLALGSERAQADYRTNQLSDSPVSELSDYQTPFTGRHFSLSIHDQSVIPANPLPEGSFDGYTAPSTQAGNPSMGSLLIQVTPFDKIIIGGFAYLGIRRRRREAEYRKIIGATD